MKTIISYLCVISSLFPIISSSLPIPGKHYVLSAIQELVPVTTGIFAGVGATAGTPLGPEGIAAGYGVGFAVGMAGGAAGGAVAGTWQQLAKVPCSRNERSRVHWGTKAIVSGGLGAALAGIGGSLTTIPVAAGTTAMVDGALRKLDPHAGLCDRPY